MKLEGHKGLTFGAGLLGPRVTGGQMKQVDMFGVPQRANPGGGALAQAFIVPPFSVLSARDGWWQERKRAWLALGIKSEVGPGGQAGTKLTMSETIQRLKPSADQALKHAAPGGSPRPAMDYSRGGAVETGGAK